jgi:hypothetical protein
MAIPATETLAATGNGLPVTMRRGYLRLSGTWVGTVNVQVQLGGTWSNMSNPNTGTDLAFTANQSFAIDNAIALPTRVNWTRTSGSLVYFLTGESNE